MHISLRNKSCYKTRLQVLQGLGSDCVRLPTLLAAEVDKQVSSCDNAGTNKSLGHIVSNPCWQHVRISAVSIKSLQGLPALSWRKQLYQCPEHSPAGAMDHTCHLTSQSHMDSSDANTGHAPAVIKTVSHCIALLSYFAAATMPSLASVKAPINDPSCRRSLVPNASLCSTSARASTRNILSRAGMSILNTHLRNKQHFSMPHIAHWWQPDPSSRCQDMLDASINV